MRLIIVSISLSLLYVSLFWLSESGRWLMSSEKILISFLLILIVSQLLIRRSRIFLRIFTFVISVLLAYMIFYFAEKSFQTAFNRCQLEGEMVRKSLLIYKNKHDHFPDSLKDLELEKTPCNRLLNPSILNYELSETGYNLFFSDSIVSFTSSEKDGFSARK